MERTISLTLGILLLLALAAVVWTNARHVQASRTEMGILRDQGTDLTVENGELTRQVMTCRAELEVAVATVEQPRIVSRPLKVRPVPVFARGKRIGM